MLPLDRNIWLVAADAPLSEYSDTAIAQCLQDLDCVSAHAVAHEATIAGFFERWPVIPLKLFTIFANDDRAIHHLRPRAKHIRRLFDLVRDHQEWGVRFTIDPARVSPPAFGAAPASGRDYLRTKKQNRRQSLRAIGPTRKQATAAISSLARLAASTRRIKRSTAASPASVVEAAYLVPSRRSQAWAARAKTLGAQLAKHGCLIEITGPWPPYNFVSARRS